MKISAWEKYRCEGFWWFYLGGGVFCGLLLLLFCFVGFLVVVVVFCFVFLLLKDVELLVQRFHIQADIYMHKKPCSVYFCICRALLSFS